LPIKGGSAFFWRKGMALWVNLNGYLRCWQWFFLIIMFNFNNALAGQDNNPIIDKLNEIQDTLDYEVIPYVHKCCVGVPKTGQTVTSRDGDDGYWEKGVAPQNPRFIANGDGTVTDTSTNLMWAISAQHFGIEILMNWWDGIDACNNMIFAGYDDWRMPNTREMLSVMDYGYYDPALKPGHPFTDIPLGSSTYWSSTTLAVKDIDAFHVPLKNATINLV
jgi:hypothetical protein